MSRENGILDLIVKREWYEKIESGQKKIEYREAKPYWFKRLFTYLGDGSRYIRLPTNSKVRFSLGYKRTKSMLFEISKLKGLQSGKDTDLKIDKPVFAIYLGKRIDEEDNDR